MNQIMMNCKIQEELIYFLIRNKIVLGIQSRFN